MSSGDGLIVLDVAYPMVKNVIAHLQTLHGIQIITVRLTVAAFFLFFLSFFLNFLACVAGACAVSAAQQPRAAGGHGGRAAAAPRHQAARGATGPHYLQPSHFAAAGRHGHALQSKERK